MAEPRVVVVGSINTDLVVAVERLPAPGETVSGGTFARHGGGKGANQAVAAARLGAAVAIVGAVGDDEFGEQALDELSREGVDVAAVARLHGVASGVAAIVVDAAGENQIAVASGANARLDPAHVTAALATLLSGHPGVVLLSHEVGDDALTAAARAAGAAGWTLVLNPAPARDIAEPVLDAGPILTPNAAEAEQLTGERDPRRAALALSRRTGASVVVTLGARGALLLDHDEPEHIEAPGVEVVDTTGAGDTLNGALAAELAAGRGLVAAARFAVVAAGLSTRAAGARGGMPRRADLPRPDDTP